MATRHDDDPHRAHWKGAARRFAQRWNGAWFLHVFAGPFGIVLIVTAAGVYVLRLTGQPLGPWAVAAGLAILLLAFRTHRNVSERYLTPDNALAEMDDAAQLKGVLVAAAAGAGAWPPPVRLPLRLQWRAAREGAAIVTPALMVVGALFAPLPKPPPSQAFAPPPQLAALQEVADALDATAGLDERALDEFRRRIDSLVAQPATQWYSHASLEAADVLQDRIAEEVVAMGGAAAAAAEAMNMLSESLENPGEPWAGATDAAAAALAEALRNLDAAGNLSVDPQLAERLREAATNPRALDAQQLAEMAQRLQELSEACEGQCDALNNSGARDARIGRRPGRGDIQRGPGDAPMVLGDETQPTGSDHVEALEPNTDPDLLPGETARIEASAPQPLEIEPAGAPSAAPRGRGGDAVWRTAATPDEAGVLKRYFD